MAVLGDRAAIMVLPLQRTPLIAGFIAGIKAAEAMSRFEPEFLTVGARRRLGYLTVALL